MILTNDGGWAQRVLHPRYGLERQYAVQLDRLPHPDDLARLLAGIEIDGVPARLLSAKRGRRPPQVDADAAEPGPWLTVRLGEGRNREVRRLFATLGLSRPPARPHPVTGPSPSPAWSPRPGDH